MAFHFCGASLTSGPLDKESAATYLLLTFGFRKNLANVPAEIERVQHLPLRAGRLF